MIKGKYLLILENKYVNLLTDFYMWMLENDYDHNIRSRVEKKARMFLNNRR